MSTIAAKLKRARRSIVTRMLVLALVVVMLGFVVRLVVLRSILTEDVGALSSAHQLAIAEYAARDVEDKLRLRLDFLSGLAFGVSAMLGPQPERLSSWLSSRRLVLSFFPEGLRVFAPDGRLLASDREAVFDADAEWVQQVARSGIPDVGKPFRLNGSGDPALTFAVPVRSPVGNIIAVLTGTSTINAKNFLRTLRDERVGRTGDFLLVDPRHGLFVTAGASGRDLKPLPPPGLNPLHDRAMAGFRGAGITTNVAGVEELSAIATVPTTGWFVVARTPTAEALQPVNHLAKLVITSSAIIPLIVLSVLLATLPRIFRPLTQTAAQLHKMASGEMEIRALPVYRDDEVGEVAKGFNFLLGVLREKERALMENEARLSHLAHHDMLTGLPNRAMFEDRLEQALNRSERQDEAFALLYIDLDGFKPINDKSGHAAGDAILCHVARRLTDSIRQSDTVARIGGDEFVILLGTLSDPLADAILVAEQCRANASQPLLHGGQALSVDLSIGIACYPLHGRSAGELLRYADQAMYRVKQRNKSARA